MCYIWNNKAYKVALTFLDYQGGTKTTNYNSTATWVNNTTTIDFLLGCYIHHP
jgi:hypothetical protein